MVVSVVKNSFDKTETTDTTDTTTVCGNQALF